VPGCWIPVTRRAASINAVLQGSALWCAPESSPAKFQSRSVREAHGDPFGESRHAVRAQGIQAAQLLDSGSTASGSPVLQGSALLRTPESSPAKFQARSAREAHGDPFGESRPRFMRKGFKVPSCWIPAARRAAARFCRGLPYCAPEASPAKFQARSAREAHGDPFAESRHAVRAQGIGGARSGRVKQKIPCKAWDFLLGVTEPPQSPVFCYAVCRAFLPPEGAPDTSRKACCWISIAWRAPEHGFTVNQAIGGVMGGLLTATNFASTADGVAKNAPKSALMRILDGTSF
jgi:hypothetical protein